VKNNLAEKERSFMKFLIGMICGLVVAIAVPMAVVVTGAAAQGDGLRPQKSTPPRA
jgi:hypothetical protein